MTGHLPKSTTQTPKSPIQGPLDPNIDTNLCMTTAPTKVQRQQFYA